MAFEESVTRPWFEDILCGYALKYIVQTFTISDPFMYQRQLLPILAHMVSATSVLLNLYVMYSKPQITLPTTQLLFCLF